jgi:hypothetical protein
MSDPLDKDELEKLKTLELASYVPPYSNAVAQELYRKAIEPWWKRLWYKIKAVAVEHGKLGG